MKWNNKGHQYDKYRVFWRKKSGGLVIYGVNNMAAEIIERVHMLGGEIILVDDLYKGEELVGQTILGVTEALPYMLDEKYITVFTVIGEKEVTIIDELKRGMCFINIDFFDGAYFVNRMIPIFSKIIFDKTYISFIGHFFSSACTLRCKNCSAAVPYNKGINLPLETIIKEIDLLFSKVDYIHTYDVTNGETFCSSQVLKAVIPYLFSRYGDKFGSIYITTNATIIPPKELLEIIHKYKERISINLSNYPNLPGWIEKYNAFCEELRIWNIGWNDIKVDNWIDFGLRQNSRGTEEDAIKKFNECKNFCRLYWDGKLAYCGHGMLNEMVFWKDEEDIGEYLDLRDKSLSGVQIVEFLDGYQEKGFINICRHCNGWGSANNKKIPVAEQLEKDC